MKFQIWLWVGLFTYALPLFAQETTPLQSSNPIIAKTPIKPAFEAGEWFKFRIHYGIFNASYATLELTESSWDGQPALYARGIGRTTGLARLFFKVDDYYSSYFKKKTIVRCTSFATSMKEAIKNTSPLILTTRRSWLQLSILKKKQQGFTVLTQKFKI